MLTLSFGGTTNSFTVGDLRSTSISFHVMLTLQAVDNDFKVKLTHTRNNSLAGFFIGMNAEGWIFFSKLSETETHFFLVSLSLRFNSNRNRWLWEFDRFKVNWVGWITESGTSGGFLETDDSSNIASSNLRNFLTLISEHTDETTDAFFIAGSSVQDVRARFQNTRVDTDEDELTDKWVRSNLESKSGERFSDRSLTDNLIASLWIGTNSLTKITVKR